MVQYRIQLQKYMLYYFITEKSDASIKLKYDTVKNIVCYFILDTDISVYNDTIISHFAMGSIGYLYLTFLSSSITIKYENINDDVGITGRELYILRIDPLNQKIMPYKPASIETDVSIHIYYIKRNMYY